ncbi:bifunctional phosphatase PAP2/diacylglycerol kinase family protein [Streptomyces sp. NPDC059002]|uniref:bifunctional phosphatase PAP2/diacylglycerol kinase family protein n=1 Tax=Streptomyces sp. NPDC059002 TaxID=3346690 RepID=UPI00367BF2F3
MAAERAHLSDIDLPPHLPAAWPGAAGDSVRARLVALDRRMFDAVASRHWPGADRLLPRLSHAANHGVLWLGAAAGIAASRTPRGRRAAVRGIASLALASATINTVGKRSVRRARPLLHTVPLIRQLKRQPITTSFPSGHSASAAAFATGVALESRAWGAGVAPVAGAVALSRVYTGAHFPSDILAGAALGAGAAFAVRGLVPTRAQLPPPAPRTDAPALPGGAGLVLVTGPGPRAGHRADELRHALPLAEVITCEPASFADELAKAAGRARALGVCGDDGSVNAAAAVALRHGRPLAVLPCGAPNHFAYDIGVEETRDLCRAVAEGGAAAVDVGRFSATADSDASAGAGNGAGRLEGIFLNTLSLGVRPELVRGRDRWAQRIGDRPATVLAALRTADAERPPMNVEIGGRTRPLRMLFVGNCAYRSPGLTPGRRTDLADGLLDVRTAGGGRDRPRGLRVSGIAPGTPLTYDGASALVQGELRIDKLPEGLTVYRPLTPTR